MKFEFNPVHRNTPPEEFIEDVKRVAKENQKNSVSVSEYRKKGRFHPSTITNKFGSWNKALEAANLEKTMVFGSTEEELFKNLENVWTALGRQPKAKEFKKPISSISITPYLNTFGTFQKALKAFVDYINQETDNDAGETETDLKNQTQEKTKTIKRSQREVSDRLRFKILLRDGFTCVKCGRSPLKSKNVELHVDHIIPWSKGGETIPENLETKCKECNLGKGNAFNV